MMIDPKDIRLGNYFMINDREISAMTEDHIDVLFGARDYESYAPIPLTPLILDKCGFKYDDEKQWWYWNPELQNFEIRVLELPFSYGEWHISKGFMTWNDELRDVKYLHELQNAVYFGLGYEINYTV